MIGKLLTAGGAVAGVVALGRARDWGATAEERTALLPGDELVPEPADSTTMAVGVDAPAAEVWQWLVQVGQGRGGMYSYDLLENLVGLDIHSAEEIRQEWQDLAVGDRVVLVPEGWPALPAGYALPVARLDPGRAIVLRQEPPEHPWNAVWSFVVEPVDEWHSRLLSRSRAEPPSSAALRAATAAMDPVRVLMTRRMLLGIKERAERSIMIAMQGMGPASAASSRREARGALLRCAATTVRLLARGRLRLPVDHVGLRLLFGDGCTARVYRETVVVRGPAAAPCVLVVGFRLRGVRGRRGHAAFRRESILNTPLFAGFPGLLTKLWLAHDENGTYRGLYEWDGADAARAYVRSLSRVLGLVCVPGSVRSEVLPGVTRSDVLPPPGRPGLPGHGEWWRPVAALGQ